ncbi:metal-dependent hydrolase [Burkholderia sp. Ac-20345]|uniref:metal-dependent hydrolase n=1 Tax=Burkholderia sp. Ac-20345 TaxID=2703891 RepID=UPI00197C4255|nr:metal-dependent hydrolase [Burkholderia sp. Ac-20345]MBN3779764.1 metal-dependent hydrolase [Burkholderia sp. Ac-20345]
MQPFHRTPADSPASRMPTRDVRFAIDERIPRFWYRGTCHVTRFFDAFSVMFPLGERFFIESVRPFRDQVGGDATLAADVDAFVRQEASHIRVHRLYNARLAAQRVPVDALEALLEKRQRNAARQVSPVTRLALTACLEHYTTILAHRLLSDPAILDGADPTMAAVWRWHAIEETEHKTVAFDVFAAAMPNAVRRYVVRCAAMLGISVYFVIDLIYFVHRLVAVDGQTWNVRGWLQLLRWLFVAPGIFTRVMPMWLFWFSPRFHPDRLDSDAALRAARTALEPYLASAEPEPEPESHA